MFRYKLHHLQAVNLSKHVFLSKPQFSWMKTAGEACMLPCVITRLNHENS